MEPDSQTGETNIWIAPDWYIPVDENGYVKGPCFEGMLGCVLQAKKSQSNATTPPSQLDRAGEASGTPTRLAIKIPRLLADTIEENAYICKLTEYEQAAVEKIEGLGGNIAGLLQAEIFQVDPLRR